MTDDDFFKNAIADSIRDAVKAKLTGYQSPIDPLISRAIANHEGSFRSMLEVAISSCVNDEAFREEIAVATRRTLAKALVQRFGGEIEKQVNALKGDPTTRAKITLAIDEIVKGAR